MPSELEFVLIIAAAISLIITSVAVIASPRINSRYRGNVDSRQYYKISKEEDPDIRSYTGHSY